MLFTDTMEGNVFFFVFVRKAKFVFLGLDDLGSIVICKPILCPKLTFTHTVEVYVG